MFRISDGRFQFDPTSPYDAGASWVDPAVAAPMASTGFAAPTGGTYQRSSPMVDPFAMDSQRQAELDARRAAHEEMLLEAKNRYESLQETPGYLQNFDEDARARQGLLREQAIANRDAAMAKSMADVMGTNRIASGFLNSLAAWRAGDKAADLAEAQDKLESRKLKSDLLGRWSQDRTRATDEFFRLQGGHGGRGRRGYKYGGDYGGDGGGGTGGLAGSEWQQERMDAMRLLAPYREEVMRTPEGERDFMNLLNSGVVTPERVDNLLGKYSTGYRATVPGGGWEEFKVGQVPHRKNRWTGEVQRYLSSLEKDERYNAAVNSATRSLNTLRGMLEGSDKTVVENLVNVIARQSAMAEYLPDPQNAEAVGGEGETEYARGIDELLNVVSGTPPEVRRLAEAAISQVERARLLESNVWKTATPGTDLAMMDSRMLPSMARNATTMEERNRVRDFIYERWVARTGTEPSVADIESAYQLLLTKQPEEGDEEAETTPASVTGRVQSTQPPPNPSAPEAAGRASEATPGEIASEGMPPGVSFVGDGSRIPAWAPPEAGVGAPPPGPTAVGSSPAGMVARAVSPAVSADPSVAARVLQEPETLGSWARSIPNPLHYLLRTGATADTHVPGSSPMMRGHRAQQEAQQQREAWRAAHGPGAPAPQPESYAGGPAFDVGGRIRQALAEAQAARMRMEDPDIAGAISRTLSPDALESLRKAHQTEMIQGKTDIRDFDTWIERTYGDVNPVPGGLSGSYAAGTP